MANRIIAAIVVTGSAFISLGYFGDREILIKKLTKTLSRPSASHENDKKALKSINFRLLGVVLLLIASLIQLWLSFRSPFHTGVFGLGTHYTKYSEGLARSRYQESTEVF